MADIGGFILLQLLSEISSLGKGSWSRPTNNALGAPHTLGYQCLHAAAEAEDGRSAFVKLLAMTLATSYFGNELL
jgi:hypothetical protein